LKNLIIDENVLNFEVLPFPLMDVAGKEVLKVRHFNRDGTKGLIYTELVEPNKMIWLFLKEKLAPEYLRKVDGEDLVLKNYLFLFLERFERTIIKVVSHKDLISDIVYDVKLKNLQLAVMSIPEFDSVLIPNNPNYLAIFLIVVD
jgi:hypothetical protein